MPIVARIVAALMPALKELVIQILIALGISVVTYQGVDLILDEMLDYISENYIALDGVVVQLLNLAGVGEAINILMGACTFIISFSATTSVFKIFNKG